MTTLRGRLVVGFVLIMGGAMIVLILTFHQIQRAEASRQLDERAETQIDRIVSSLAELFEETERQRDATGQEDPPTLNIPAVQLRAIPDFVVIYDNEGQFQFLSDAANQIEEFEALVGILDPDRIDEEQSGHITISSIGELRYLIRPTPAEVGPNIGAVMVALPTAGLTLGTRRVLATIFLMMPFILGVAVLAGNVLVGSTTNQLNRILDELEDISDGRSLHRRLPVSLPFELQEIGRLTSELNAMLARLETSFDSLRRFTADASHELKTPLTVLRSSVERLLTFREMPPEALETIEETLVEVRRMSDLVESLLVLARADEGVAPLHREMVVVRELAEEVHETATLLAEDRGIYIDVTAPDGDDVVFIDRGRVRQLLVNLLSNAMKYTPPGGKVTVAFQLDDAELKMIVTDTGIGIAPGDLPRIFDRFWRVNHAQTARGVRPGSGLGLSICKWIAEAHGGTILARSRPGRGTTFTATVPRKGPPEPPDSATVS